MTLRGKIVSQTIGSAGDLSHPALDLRAQGRMIAPAIGATRGRKDESLSHRPLRQHRRDRATIERGPSTGAKDVLMRVRASSLNYRDLMVLKGGGRGPTKPGVIPLSDGAGDVEAVGEEVTRVKVGDRIAGCFHPRWFGGPIKPNI